MKGATQRDLGSRLRSAAGHVQGIERMVRLGEPCPSILHQVFAVQQALDRVAQILVEEHVDDCLQLAGTAKEAELFEEAVRGLASLYEAKGVGRGGAPVDGSAK